MSRLGISCAALVALPALGSSADWAAFGVDAHQVPAVKAPEPGRPVREEAPAGPDAESEWVVSGSEESIPWLINHLKSKESLIQRMALAEFAALGPKAKPAVPTIVAALNDSKSSIRVQAAAALIYLNFENEAAFRTLKAEMKGKDADERSNEAWELICTRPN